MTNILALYRGRTVAEAQLVAVTTKPDVVERFIRDLVGDEDDAEGRNQETPAEREPLRVLRADDEQPG